MPEYPRLQSRKILPSLRVLIWMNFELQKLDWQLFWVVEVILLGVPTLVTVIVFRGGTNLSLHRAGLLVIILIGLTIANLMVRRSRAAG